MYPFITSGKRTPTISLSSAPSRDGQGVRYVRVPNERDSEYASSTEVTEIEFHRRASDYPREEEMNCTLRYNYARGCASRAYLCLCTFYPLELSVKRGR